MADFNDPLPSTYSEPARTDAEQRQADHEDQLLAEEARAIGKTDLDGYTVELQEREVEQRRTLDVIEGLRKLETGDPIRWSIYRVDAQDPEKLGYLAEWSTVRLTQQRLRDEFGAGVYRIEGNLPNGRYVRRRTVTIAEDAPRRMKDNMNANASGFNMQEFLAHQDAMEARRRAQDEERRRAEEERERRKEEQEEKRRLERKDMLIALGPAALAAIAQIFGGRQDNTAALVAALKPPDPLTMLTQLKALQGNGQDQTLNRILPMLIDMAGSKAAGGDTGWLDVIKEFAKGAGPAVGSLIQHQLTQPVPVPGMSVTPATGPSNPPLTGALPAPSMNSIPATDGISRSSMLVVPESIPRRERPRRTAPDPSTAAPPVDGSRGRPAATAASPSPSNPGSGEMNLLTLLPHLPWLKDMLVRMLAAAARGKDPEVYAALFLEEVPEDITAEQIVGLLAPENWFQQLCQLEPRWNDARVYPWIEHVRGLILRQVAPPVAGQASGAAQTSAGPGVSQANTPTPSPRSAPRSAEVERPRKLPSLTGD